MKVLMFGGMAVSVLALGVLTFIGPWPTYSDGFEGKVYFTNAVAAIDANAKESEITASPGRLQAGWASRCITPPKSGVPLAGYGDRKGAPSTGAHDEVYAKALALSDGKDTVVLIGADMLLIPENMVELVRANVAQKTPLTANDLYFAASHSHSSVGGFGPGLVAYAAAGKYDPQIPVFLANQFTAAIVEAYESMKPAKLASGSVQAEQYIKNRTRNAPVDPELSYLVVEQDGGKQCYVVNYSAHPTVLDGDNMQFSAEYPGCLQQALEATGATAIYLGGAVGSMGPRAPEAADAFARCKAMGEGLAKLILDDVKKKPPKFESNLDVVSDGVLLQLPPLQLRLLSPKWRLSKFVGPLGGLDDDGWVHGVRVGNLVFIGMPADFSGEISRKWKEAAAATPYDLWVTGFCADYVGYVSPDEYYSQVTDDKGSTEYETGLMSWTGPHQEAYFTALKDKLIAAMTQGGV